MEEDKKMKVLLNIEDGPGGKETFEFDRHDTFVVGRSKINTHSQLKGDGYISRHHFILELNPPYCFLKDLGSTNGTKVNGRKLSQGELLQLNDRDQINVGKTTLRIDMVGSEEEKTLILDFDVLCKECGKDVFNEVADKSPEELKKLVYTCKECMKKKIPAKPLIEVRINPVLCEKCNKDITEMADRDGKMEELRYCTNYYCQLCKPLRDIGLDSEFIGDYDLLKLLGKGGMGVVYKAWHRITGRIVALKKILPMAAMKEKNHKLFQREMAVMSKLSHKNIIRIFDQKRIGNEHYFATEFLNEGDASDLMIKKYLGPIPYEEACNIMCQTLEGLEFAHSKGYIHRDIKPQNILLHTDKKGLKAKLSDFGLAKNFQDAGGSMMTKEGEVGGTVLFMAPEQLLNYKYVKPPADVYSMGVSLYYMITGKYPFEYPSPIDVMIAMRQGIRIDMRKYPDPLLMVLTETPVPVERRNCNIPPSLARVVNKSILKIEKDRYGTAREFREDLLKALR